jgi:hypothetical protein
LVIKIKNTEINNENNKAFIGDRCIKKIIINKNNMIKEILLIVLFLMKFINIKIKIPGRIRFTSSVKKPNNFIY